MRFHGWLPTLLVTLGCGPAVLVGGDDESTTAATTTTRGDEANSVDPNPSTTSSPTTTVGSTTSTTDPTSGSTTESSEVEGGVFIPDPDTGWPIDECDLFEQDCPRGEKCMPWANDGGSTWNALRCSPVDPNPAAKGQPCTVEGSGVSGIDNCDYGAMCWDVDPETNTGVCVAFCVGSEANPLCEQACEECSITSSGPLALCFANCDPLDADCPDGDACYPSYSGFACVPDGGGADMGAVGEPCEYLNVCDPGSFCANAELVPGCDDQPGCCSPYCEAAAEVDPCDALLPGTSCVPWFEEGQQPETCIGEGLIGACLLPR